MRRGPDRVVLLVGSPKAGGSTSEALGRYLLDRMGLQEGERKTLFLSVSLRTEEGRTGLLSAARRADLLVLASPLYADSFPWGVTRFFELYTAEISLRSDAARTRLVLLVNCGFPEARHCDVALSICRCFAREAGMDWTGGLALGGGESVGGRPLEEAGGIARGARKALELAAAALCEGRELPPEAVSLMARPMMSSWVYIRLGNLGWRLRARKQGASGRLRDRPYLAQGSD